MQQTMWLVWSLCCHFFAAFLWIRAHLVERLDALNTFKVGIDVQPALRQEQTVTQNVGSFAKVRRLCVGRLDRGGQRGEQLWHLVVTWGD